MTNILKLGSHVIYIDEDRKEIDALITAIHGAPEHDPAVNLVFVNAANGSDQYGAQTKHESSVTHCTDNSAGGRCWRHKE